MTQSAEVHPNCMSCDDCMSLNFGDRAAARIESSNFWAALTLLALTPGNSNGA